MTDSAFAAFTITTCSTERASLTSDWVANLSGLKCTPLAPISAETRNRLVLDTPTALYEAHLQGNPDIINGDRLVIGSKKYPIRAVEHYTWIPTVDVRVRLVVEELKK